MSVLAIMWPRKSVLLLAYRLTFLYFLYHGSTYVIVGAKALVRVHISAKRSNDGHTHGRTERPFPPMFTTFTLGGDNI